MFDDAHKLSSSQRTAFKNYVIDNDKLIKKCFEFDWNHMRPLKYKVTPENEIKEIMRTVYLTLKEAYRAHSGIGMVGHIFSIGLNVFTELIREDLALIDGNNLKMADADTASPQNFLMAARLLDELKKNAEASEYWLKIAAVFPDNYEAHNQLASYFENSGQPDRALDHLLFLHKKDNKQ